MRRLGVWAVILVASAAWAGAAGAAGTWTTYLRAYGYTDLLTAGDTVWCATLEAGIKRYDAARGRFDTFTRDPSGLASNRVTCMAMDRSRRLWVGTRGAGLSRLSADRTKWDLFDPYVGIPSDTITCLRAQGDTVFIGTTKGIALWDGRTVAGAVPDGVNPSPFASNSVTGFVPFGDSVWVATQAGVYVAKISQLPLTWSAVNVGLFAPTPQALVTDGRQLLTLVNAVPYVFDFAAARWYFAGSWSTIGNVVRLTEDHGVIVVATSLGIYRWNPALPPPAGAPPGDWDVVQLGAPYLSSTDPRDTRHMFAVAVDALDPTRLYAADGSGLYTLDAGCTTCPLSVPSNPPGNGIQNLALQGSRLYLNTEDEGAGRFDGNAWYNWYPVPCVGAGCDTTFEVAIYTFGILVDRTGKKWISCWDRALEEIDDSVQPPRFVHHREALADPISNPQRHSFGWATAEDPAGGRWIGLETNSDAYAAIGLDYYGPSGDFIRNFRPDSALTMTGSQIRGLAVDRRGRFWVGYTKGGLQFFDWPLPAGSGPLPGPPQFFTVSGTNTTTYFVQSLVLNGDSLWVLTSRELRRYDARSANQVSGAIFSLPGGPARNAIRPIDVARDGSVWVGTDAGIRVFHPGGAIDDFTTGNSPLPANDVRAIAVDRTTGVIWIGTGAGLVRYDPFYVENQVTSLGSLTITIRPNPTALTGIGTPLLLKGNSDVYSGAVYDLNGRIVREFSGIRDGQVFWTGLDRDGSVVRPGVYFVRAESHGRTGTARVALVR